MKNETTAKLLKALYTTSFKDLTKQQTLLLADLLHTVPPRTAADILNDSGDYRNSCAIIISRYRELNPKFIDREDIIADACEMLLNEAEEQLRHQLWEPSRLIINGNIILSSLLLHARGKMQRRKAVSTAELVMTNMLGSFSLAENMYVEPPVPKRDDPFSDPENPFFN